MRIALFSNLFPPVVSGSSTQVEGLARALVADGHEVLVVTSRIDSAWPTFEQRDGYAVLRLPAWHLPRAAIALNFPWLNSVLRPSNLRRALLALRDFAPDVLHIHNHMFDMAFVAGYVARRLAKPTVLTVHTVIRHSTPAFDRVLVPVDRYFLGPAVVRRVDLVLSPDAEVQRYVQESFGDVPQRLVRYGIDEPPPIDTAAVTALRRRYGLDDDQDVIVSVGHCHALRDRRDLIHAMPAVLRRRPRTVLCIVGSVGVDGPRRWCRELDIERQVIFTDAVPHDAVYTHLGLGDIECHWLNNQEPEKTSLGVASLEAMLLGKVVVAAASAAAYGEGVFAAGREFVFVKPHQPEALADELLRLLEQPERRREIGERAQKAVHSHFGWASVCRATVAAYEDAQRLFGRR